LVAEDDLTTRRILQFALGQWGYDVTAVEDGAAAWQVLQGDESPQLALLDWMMPGLEGIEVCRRVRGQHGGGSMYIILLTSRDEQDDIVRGLDAGANDYIVKPFEPEELRARLAVGGRVVELQEQLRQAERTRVLAEAAGATAHEINQPLTALMGTVELLAVQLAPGDPMREAIEAILQASASIGATVKTMAAAANGGGGATRPNAVVRQPPRPPRQ